MNIQAKLEEGAIKVQCPDCKLAHTFCVDGYGELTLDPDTDPGDKFTIVEQPPQIDTDPPQGQLYPQFTCKHCLFMETIVITNYQEL